MSKIVSIDTNVALRWILQDVPAQTSQVMSLLNDDEITQIHISDMVFAEIVWILASERIGFDRRMVVISIGLITSFPKVVCNQKLLDQVLPEYEASNAVSFIDLCLAKYANINSAAPLLTFDKKLANKSKYAEILSYTR